MLDAIKRREGDIAGEALIMELLDTLRAARQEHELRMIYTGSLGTASCADRTARTGLSERPHSTTWRSLIWNP